MNAFQDKKQCVYLPGTVWEEVGGEVRMDGEGDAKKFTLYV